MHRRTCLPAIGKDVEPFQNGIEFCQRTELIAIQDRPNNVRDPLFGGRFSVIHLGHAKGTNFLVLSLASCRNQPKLSLNGFSRWFRSFFSNIMNVHSLTLRVDCRSYDMHMRMSCIGMPVHQIWLVAKADFLHVAEGDLL